LRGVNVGKATGLRGHGVRDFGNSVADGDHGCAACGVKITLAIRSEDETTFAANGLGIGFEKISGKNGFVGHGPPVTAKHVVNSLLDSAACGA
jgi:hypothetical protein